MGFFAGQWVLRTGERGSLGPGGLDRLCYTYCVRTTRLLAAIAALTAPGTTCLAAEEGTRLSLASIQAPGLDWGRLSQLFDRARLRAQSVTAVARQAPRPAPTATGVHFQIGPEPVFAVKKPAHPPLIIPQPKPTAAYRRTFNLLLNNPERTDRYDAIILKHARFYRLDPRLLKAVIAAESEFVTTAVSPKGALGLMQVMPKTAEAMGVPPHKLTKPEWNIRAGAAYLAWLFNAAWKRYKLQGVRYADAPLWIKQRIIAAYNAGPRFLFRYGGWHTQTKHYVRKVLLFHGSAVTDMARPSRAYEAAPALPAAPTFGTLH